MIYTTADGTKHVDKVPFNKKIELRTFTIAERRRMEEIAFYTVINQIYESKVAAKLPSGTTVPKMLAALLNLNSGVIDHAFNMLSMPVNRPETDETCVTLKVKAVPAAKSMYTAETYYKGLKRWVQAGKPELVPRLAELQHKHLQKFLAGYGKAFLGKRTVSAALLK